MGEGRAGAPCPLTSGSYVLLSLRAPGDGRPQKHIRGALGTFALVALLLEVPLSLQRWGFEWGWERVPSLFLTQRMLLSVERCFPTPRKTGTWHRAALGLIFQWENHVKTFLRCLFFVSAGWPGQAPGLAGLVGCSQQNHSPETFPFSVPVSSLICPVLVIQGVSWDGLPKGAGWGCPQGAEIQGWFLVPVPGLEQGPVHTQASPAVAPCWGSSPEELR